MNSKIFREKSIEKVSTPEELDDYLRITKPSVWLILIAILILLAGLLVVSMTKEIEMWVNVGGVCEDGILTLYIDEEDAASVRTGMQVFVDEQEYIIYDISSMAVAVTADVDAGALHESGIAKGDWMYIAHAQCDLDDGLYSAEILTEAVKPIMFMINGVKNE